MTDGVAYGDYFLLGRLAAGGMAEVFLGKSLRKGEAERLLAIKRMLPHLSHDPKFVTMFNDEARIASGLIHPNICRIHDRGQHDEQLYIVMEFIHGKDLRVLQRRAKKRGEHVPYSLVAFIIAKIAEALSYAHAKRNDEGLRENIVHRDVSPQNILLSYAGEPKLIDFGIAKAKHRLAQTRVGVVKGKLAYMSPEQARGHDLDSRSDLFSLGVVLYELLTGCLPFRASSDLATLKLITRAQYAPPRELNPKIPEPLVSVIERALSLEPEARYTRGSEMSRELLQFIDGVRPGLGERTVSSYMRELFREDLEREMQRIKEFRAAQPPKLSVTKDVGSSVRLPEEVPAPQDGVGESTTTAKPNEPTTLVEQTVISPTQFLAAGYDEPQAADSAEGAQEEAAEGAAGGIGEQLRQRAHSPAPSLLDELEQLSSQRRATLHEGGELVRKSGAAARRGTEAEEGEFSAPTVEMQAPKNGRSSSSTSEDWSGTTRPDVSAKGRTAKSPSRGAGGSQVKAELDALLTKSAQKEGAREGEVERAPIGPEGQVSAAAATAGFGRRAGRGTERDARALSAEVVGYSNSPEAGEADEDANEPTVAVESDHIREMLAQQASESGRSQPSVSEDLDTSEAVDENEPTLALDADRIRAMMAQIAEESSSPGSASSETETSSKPASDDADAGFLQDTPYEGVAMDPGAHRVDIDEEAGTHELENDDLPSIMEVARSFARTTEQSEPMTLPEQPEARAQEDDEPPPTRVIEMGARETEQRAQEASGDEEGSAEFQGSTETDLSSAPHSPSVAPASRQWLTRAEVAILFVVALLGLGLVFGAHYVAAHTPIENLPPAVELPWSGIATFLS